MDYQSTAETLAQRIVALIPANPDILSMTSAWDLFKVDGFKYDDLEPSYFQASWALGRAKAIHAEQNGSEASK